MPANNEQRGDQGSRGGSPFMRFWTSLPGVLTGAAALITAVATLAALDFGGADGGGDDGQRSAGAPARAESTAMPAAGQPGCFAEYFADVAADRIDRVEEGTADFDTITEKQPKGGTIGLRFEVDEQPVAAMRLAYYSGNSLFKIESIVDANCGRVEDYENVSRGGDKNVLQNWDTVRFRLDGTSYDLRIGASSTIRLGFTEYAE